MLLTFLKPKDGEPDNRTPLDDDGLLHCKTVYYTDPKGKVSSIHFTLRVPEPRSVQPKQLDDQS